MESAIKCNAHKRIYINIGRNKKRIQKKNKMCNKIKCAGQYTVDLINYNIRGCASRMCKQVVQGINIAAIRMM